MAEPLAHRPRSAGKALSKRRRIIYNRRRWRLWEHEPYRGAYPPTSARLGRNHLGFGADRLDYPSGDLERAFADRWQEENEYKYWTPPILYALLNGRRLNLLKVGLGYRGEEPIPPLNPVTVRDTKIAATVIQWLGTNVGFAFLEEVLRSQGYRIERPRLDRQRLTRTASPAPEVAKTDA